MPRVEDHRIVEMPTEAHAGVTGHNVRYVLVFGTLGAAIAFMAVYLYFFA